VTTVGGTTGIPEVAASLSGGGFSNYFAQPSYQASAVSRYLASLGNTYAGMYKYDDSASFVITIYKPYTRFSQSGRAFPDVAAQAENFQVVVAGSTENVAGTSCSAPVSVFMFCPS
jgi:tripeptidyl-peptidase I